MKLGRWLPWILGVAALGALWVWADRLLPSGEAGALLIVEPDECNLNERACAVRTPSGGQALLEMAPRPMPTMQPLVATLELAGQDPAWVEIDLDGVEMYMGLNRARLDRVAPGSYRGEVVLPVCASERMTWAATLLPEGDFERGEVQFRFVTRR